MDQSKSTESLKFLCSYGGKILPRHTDGKLRYVGGLTRVLSVDRSISFAGSLAALLNVNFLLFIYIFCFEFELNLGGLFIYFSGAELMVKLVEFCGFSVVLRCQLPCGDLETLITIKSDEDLANLIEEYDRISPSSKIRAVLSPPQSLKKVSPPPSAAPSVDYESPKSVFAAVHSPPYRYASKACSPGVGIPVGQQVCFRKFGIGFFVGLSGKKISELTSCALNLLKKGRENLVRN
ncbi:hypothetical protein FEM48_Zijuj05G0068700 [Ziziphus jujuba var. spinosa]|uniref:PB1 domain-containing protein n=1 Tax=Ziziphus jujuba var. spinosa TaxID=714518 RepID=A0A978VDG5_ZIZJJ|nr:hypothetical protein FEM48_Zijuj05G0068700 [Ziziphus jujuba var. spinosa]